MSAYGVFTVGVNHNALSFRAPSAALPSASLRAGSAGRAGSAQDAGLAQDEAEFQEWVETIRRTVGSMALNLQDMAGEAVAADAKKLQELFGRVYAFFQKRSVSSAMKFADDTQSGFQEAGELASAGKMEEALAKFHATRANCTGCHRAHRKNVEGNWKIKH